MDKSSYPSWTLITKCAHNTFGVQQFREGQKSLIEAAIKGRDCIGLMPTGSGKSLCFQLPALFLPYATVVVSPLISLMLDQETKLAEQGVSVANLNSSIAAAAVRKAYKQIAAGEIKLIYVTPERLEDEAFIRVLQAARVSLLVIDEAHCISQWGHDFRPAYLNISATADLLDNPPVMALTATATDDIVADISKQLRLRDPVLVRLGIDRPNLAFKVIATVSEKIKQEKLLEFLQHHRQQGVGLVYTSTIKCAETLHAFICEHGFKCAIYHGRLSRKERELAQEAFMSGRVDLVIATKAFGMGIDKPDVRFVIHYQYPDSIESYVQEAGRAGRDGKDSEAVIFYQLEDHRVQAFFLGGKYPSRDQAQSLYECLRDGDAKGASLKMLKEATGIPINKVKVILSYLEGAGAVEKKVRYRLKQYLQDYQQLDEFLAAYEERHMSDRERLSQIESFCQSPVCRSQYLRRYFGEQQDAGVCGRCDNCQVDEGSNLAKLAEIA